MAAIYITREGDMVDYIAWKFYGAISNQAVEKLLVANPGLSDKGLILEAGLSITLPEIPLVAQTQGVKLWD